MFLCYARVSTTDQADKNASSLPDQLTKGKAVATLRGAGTFDVATYSDDGVSGSIPLSERPQGAKMLADAQKGDCIFACKMDRLFRSTLDAFNVAEQLKKKGVDLILLDLSAEPVTGKGVGKLFFGLLAVLAEFERERIAERTQDGRRAKAARSGHLGGPPPFGFEVVGQGREAKMQPSEIEQPVVATIKKLWHEHTPASAVREAERLGLRCRAGTPFQFSQLKRIAERTVVHG